jgi:hypothetical protein
VVLTCGIKQQLVLLKMGMRAMDSSFLFHESRATTRHETQDVEALRNPPQEHQ